MHTLVFDVYGTLVDTGGIIRFLEPKLGDGAVRFSKKWRQKMLEYSYRMGLMRWYKPFSECARYAFQYTSEELGVTFTEEEKVAIFTAYRTLPPFAETREALAKFHATDADCFAFSNGAPSDVEMLLGAASLSEYLDEIVSVDAIKIYKPSRIAYAYLLERIARYHTELIDQCKQSIRHKHRAADLRVSERRCLHYVESGLFEPEGSAEAVDNPVLPVPDLSKVWLISSNPFDVIGAKVSGLEAVWIKRTPCELFDPWGVEPTLTVSCLMELYDILLYKKVITPVDK